MTTLISPTVNALVEKMLVNTKARPNANVSDEYLTAVLSGNPSDMLLAAHVATVKFVGGDNDIPPLVIRVIAESLLTADNVAVEINDRIQSSFRNNEFDRETYITSVDMIDRNLIPVTHFIEQVRNNLMK